MDELSQVELMRQRRERRRKLYEQIDRDGCCGAEMSITGRCPETGHPCPMFLKAKKIEKDVFKPEDKA